MTALVVAFVWPFASFPLGIALGKFIQAGGESLPGRSADNSPVRAGAGSETPCGASPTSFNHTSHGAANV